MRIRAVLVLLLLLAARPGAAEELTVAAGRSSATVDGLVVEFDLPKDLSKSKPGSLLFVLHGAGGSATGMVGLLRGWVSKGYIVAAPKSSGQSWTQPDIQKALGIARRLKRELPIDPRKVHVLGYSAGGWALPALAFDDELHPCSATWVAAGCRGGRVPKWAPSDLGVLALAGAEDPNAPAARETVDLLDGKVRSVEARFESGLGHEWPHTLMPYLAWWTGAMEGRFVPGEDRNFDWGGSIDEAVGKLADQRRGGVLVYVYRASDRENPLAQRLQNVTLMDRMVRHYGTQLQAVKLEFAAHEATLRALGVEDAPCVLVLNKDGKPKKLVKARSLKARKLAAAFKSVAPNKKPPGK
jgi:predicted esterase